DRARDGRAHRIGRTGVLDRGGNLDREQQADRTDEIQHDVTPPSRKFAQSEAESARSCKPFSGGRREHWTRAQRRQMIARLRPAAASRGRSPVESGDRDDNSAHHDLGVVPLLASLRSYRRAWLAGDLRGGVSACVVMIPSVIAYAALADLAPQYGLYAALVGMLGYALFASSRQVIAGPDAAITLLVASTVGPLAGGDATRTVALCGAS